MLAPSFPPPEQVTEKPVSSIFIHAGVSFFRIRPTASTFRQLPDPVLDRVTGASFRICTFSRPRVFGVHLMRHLQCIDQVRCRRSAVPFASGPAEIIDVAEKWRPDRGIGDLVHLLAERGAG